MKEIVAVVIVGCFGVFLLWQGITGNVAKTAARKEIVPRWVYILGGLGMFILPVLYLVVLLQIE